MAMTPASRSMKILHGGSEDWRMKKHELDLITEWLYSPRITKARRSRR
jgi:hypothetical protein